MCCARRSVQAVNRVLVAASGCLLVERPFDDESEAVRDRLVRVRPDSSTWPRER